MNYPFHYEVRFSLLAINEDKSTKRQKHKVVIKESDALESRLRAFEEFNEFVNFLRSQDRIVKDSWGNDSIKPHEVSDKIFKANYRDITEDMKTAEFLAAFNMYYEEISVYLVIDSLVDLKGVLDEELLDPFDKEVLIHQCSTKINDETSIDVETVLDDMSLIEVPLLKHYSDITEKHLDQLIISFGGTGDEDVEIIKTSFNYKKPKQETDKYVNCFNFFTLT